MLKGHVFKKQLFGSEIFALFIDTFLDKHYGILDNYKNKMEITHTNNSITINSGVCCVGGRFIEEDNYTTLEVSSDTAKCILVLEVDLDKENTDSEFKQASYKILKSIGDFPLLTQNDIVKNNAGIYQFELARFGTEISGITNFKDRRPFINFEGIYKEIRDAIAGIKGTADLAFKEDLKAVDITSKFITNYTKRQFRALYYPYLKKVELNFRFDEIPSGNWLTLASTTNVNYKNIEQIYDVAYGNEGQFAAISMNNGALQVLGKSGQINMVSGSISYYTNLEV